MSVGEVLEYGVDGLVVLEAGVLALTAYTMRSEHSLGKLNAYTEEEARELQGFADKTMEYVAEQNIGSIALVDAAARPFYIPLLDSCNRNDHERPPIFFLNPQGFQAREDNDRVLVAKNVLKSFIKGNKIESPTHKRPANDIIDDIPTVLPGLHARREQPVLVMDTCLHTGQVVRPVLDRLEEAGFNDVRLGVVYTHPRNRGEGKKGAQSSRKPVPDLVLSDKAPAKSCYPFGLDRMPQKPYASLVSSWLKDEKRARTGTALRRNLWQAMRELPEQQATANEDRF